MDQLQLQNIYRQIFTEANQELGETSLDYYLRLEMYSILAYPNNQYDEVYRYNIRILQFVIGAHEETMSNQTVEEINELMFYILYGYGYI